MDNKDMRFLAAFLFLLGSLHLANAQDQPTKRTPFGCSAGAVSVNVDKEHPLRFISLTRPPENVDSSRDRHQFVFRGMGPFLYVTIHFSATLPESVPGMGSAARLHVYAETAVSTDDYHAGKKTWWALEPSESSRESRFDNSPDNLWFDANQIGGCFNGGTECKFADVALATPDPNLPLLAVSFTLNLGGANAANWSESSLLLDFRTMPPKVIVTADCSYNEGGGACTSYDSQEMQRTDLNCDWSAQANDFLCKEENESGHHDFYLLRDQPAPLRTNEFSSVQDAVREFRKSDKSLPILVRNVGPVSWLDEIRLNATHSVVVLGSPGKFHFISASGSDLSAPVSLPPHFFLPEEEGEQEGRENSRADWTIDLAPSLASRRLYQDQNLTVLQVMEISQQPTELFWIGVSKDPANPGFDAMELVGGGRYAGCATYDIFTSVISVGKISRPFRVPVRIQPSITASETDFPLQWRGSNSTDEIADCIHSGQLFWRDNMLQGSIDSGECASPEKPRYVRLKADGTVELSERMAP